MVKWFCLGSSYINPNKHFKYIYDSIAARILEKKRLLLHYQQIAEENGFGSDKVKAIANDN